MKILRQYNVDLDFEINLCDHDGVKCEEYFKHFFALRFLYHFNLCSDFKNFLLNSETLFICLF